MADEAGAEGGGGMDGCKFAENIFRLRRERKLTQEKLADFIGVTKASVSKWETGQSMPDVILLPQLAAFFDVTVDELIGYQPQLSKGQILKLYQEFAEEFASRPFQEVMDKIQIYVKRYYSCYPFLFQMCALLLNHYMLGEDGDRQRRTLFFLADLCGHIQEHCRDVGICNDAIILRAIAYLQLGRAQEAADVLTEIARPYKLAYQSDMVLAKAYMMLGNREGADTLIQAGMYCNVLSLVANAAEYLNLHGDNLAVCEETVSRVGQVAEAYQLARLHPNNMAVFEYQAALCYAMHQEKEKALEHLGRLVNCLSELLSGERIELHGDSYFDGMQEWFEALDNGVNAPRDKRLVLEDVREMLDQPAFGILEEEERFKRLKNRLREIGK